MCTSFKVKGQGHQTANAETESASYLPNGKDYDLLRLYTHMEHENRYHLQGFCIDSPKVR